jgi:transposase InsO family protein
VVENLLQQDFQPPAPNRYWAGDITSIRTKAGWRHLAVLKMKLDPDDNREALISSQRLQRNLAAWIEGYYNHERRHATISYLSPIDDEQQFIAAHTLPAVNS